MGAACSVCPANLGGASIWAKVSMFLQQCVAPHLRPAAGLHHQSEWGQASGRASFARERAMKNK